MGRHLAVTAVCLLCLPGAATVLAQPPLLDDQALQKHLATGARLMNAGDYPGAIAEFRHATSIDPRNREAHEHLGWCYLRTSQLQYAVRSFNSALTIAPDALDARRGLGLAYYRLGKHKECVQALRSAMPHLAEDAQIQLVYGRSLLAVGDARQALPHLRAAEAGSRRDPAVLLSIAEAHRKLKQTDQAELYYERVLQLEPKHSAALRGLLSLYQEAGRHLDARQLLRQMLTDNPNDPVLLAELAREDQALGLNQEALAIYERLSALVQGPDALELHLTLAEAYMSSQQAALARPHYQAAIAQRPEDVRLRVALGDCLTALGEFEGAAEQYQQAVRLDPQQPAIHFRRGQALARLGEIDAALAAYQTGLLMDPTNEQALTMVAQLARETSRPEVARDALVNLAALKPDGVSIRLALSDVYRDLGDLRSSDMQAWEVLRTSPANAEARRALARSAEELGDFDGAIAHLSAIEPTEGDRAYQRAPLARLLAAQGRLSEAIAEYERLVQDDPKNTLLRSDLAALYLKTRDLGRARKLLTDVLSEKPDSVWAADRLARCEALLGNTERAIRLRHQVALAAPDDKEYLESLVRLHEQNGSERRASDFLVTLLAVPDPPLQAVRTLVAAYRRHDGEAAALQQIRGLADIFRRRPVFQRAAAEACASAGVRDEALDRYSRYLAVRPDDYEVLMVVVALCRDEDRLSIAQDHLSRYVDANPRDTRSLLRLAALALENDRPTDAFAAVSRALEVDASDPSAYRILADALNAVYGPGKAVSVLRERSDATADPAPQIGLAYAHVLNGAPDEALTVLAAAVETRRSAAEAAYVRGLAEHALGLHDQAVVELARASAAPDAPPDYRARLASTLAIAGRPEDALWEYARLLTDPASEPQGVHGIRQLLAARAVAPPVACEALRRVGVHYGPSRALIRLLSAPLATEAPAETILAMRDISDVWQDSEAAWSALAQAYQAAGQPEEEARALGRLVDLRPTDVSYQLRLARAYERSGAPSRAADTYVMALAFDPDNEEARRAVERLLADEKPAPTPRPPSPPAPSPLTPPPSTVTAATPRQ
jgi:tetratricopeptide (TPR) repeat protein